MTAAALRLFRWCWPVQRAVCDSRHDLVSKRLLLIQSEIETISGILHRMALALEDKKASRSERARAAALKAHDPQASA